MKRSIESAQIDGHAALFGTTLHALRLDARWSLVRLAEATYYSASHLGNVERGTKAPTPELARACDEALGGGNRLQSLLRDRQPATAALSVRPVVAQRIMQLPAPVIPFVGREQELTSLDQLAADPLTGALVAVHGEPGVGKTQLVLTWAHHAAGTYPDGVLWVDLHGDAPASAHASPSAVLAAWFQAFGVAAESIPAGLDARIALWRSLLADRQVLIVLDNAASPAQVRPMLPSNHRSRTLITSRERFGDLSIRDGAHHLNLPPLTDHDARELLTAVLGAARVTAEPGAAATLAQRAGYRPDRLRAITDYALLHPEKTLTDLAARPDLADAGLSTVAMPPDLNSRWYQHIREVDMHERVNAGLVYNYYLGGGSNFAADREFARRSQEIIPEVAELARANRKFLARAVLYCLDHGVRQFIDIGAGIAPAAPLHEILHARDPACPIVYVDNDPVAAQAIHDITADLDTVGAVLADLRDPTRVLHDRVTQQLVDPAQPVGLVMGLMLHFIRDEDHPAELLAEYARQIAPGSHLIISHDTSDGREQDMRRFAEHYTAARQPLFLRNRVELAQLTHEFTLVAPGIVHMPLWRPDPTDPPFEQPERSCAYALVARVRDQTRGGDGPPDRPAG